MKKGGMEKRRNEKSGMKKNRNEKRPCLKSACEFGWGWIGHIVWVYLHIGRVLPAHHVRKNVVGGIEGPEPTSTWLGLGLHIVT